MKQCPKCQNLWPDEDDFCPNDGTVLAVSGDAANRVVVSWDDKPGEPGPTQFVPPPQQMPPYSVPPPAQGNSGVLYALIGALVAVVIVGGIYILNSSPGGGPPANTSPTAAPSESKNRAATPVNTPQSPQNKGAMSANSGSSTTSLERKFRSSYEGTLDGFGIQMELERDGRSLGGKVTPTRRNAADIYLDGIIEDDGSFVMDEKSDAGVVTGIYRGTMSSDGTMSGTWTKPNGDRACSFSLRRQ